MIQQFKIIEIMKSLLLIVSLFFVVVLQAQDENSKQVIPTLEVVKAFQKDFPKVKAVWRKDYTGPHRDQLSYEGDFVVNKINMTAVYNANGTFNVLEIEIKPAEIPAKISSYLAKNYPKNKINKAARVMTNANNITYEIGITLNDKWTDAIFNKEGDFLRMVQKD